jgi:hypothetical protein
MSACSVESLAVDEPLTGTAQVAQCWVIIEQPGPWGSQALLESTIDPVLGQQLLERSEGTGTSLLLARHPDRTDRNLTEHNVWVVHTSPGDCWMRHGLIRDLSELTTWDFAAMAQGQLPPIGTKVADPTMFICTHSGRDTCCAIHGRALISAVHEALPAEIRSSVWECSHLGGHRFAPTALTIPSGAVWGRLTPERALEVHAAAFAREITTESYRGRSAWPQPLQSAEAHVRSSSDERAENSLDVLWVIDDRAVPARPGVRFENLAQLVAEVRHRDGRSWRVTVRTQEIAARAESCGKDAVTGTAWVPVAMSETANWR